LDNSIAIYGASYNFNFVPFLVALVYLLSLEPHLIHLCQHDYRNCSQRDENHYHAPVGHPPASGSNWHTTTLWSFWQAFTRAGFTIAAGDVSSNINTTVASGDEFILGREHKFHQ
jgi:hypothetical protein